MAQKKTPKSTGTHDGAAYEICMSSSEGRPGKLVTDSYFVNSLQSSTVFRVYTPSLVSTQFIQSMYFRAICSSEGTRIKLEAAKKTRKHTHMTPRSANFCATLMSVLRFLLLIRLREDPLKIAHLIIIEMKSTNTLCNLQIGCLLLGAGVAIDHLDENAHGADCLADENGRRNPGNEKPNVHQHKLLR